MPVISVQTETSEATLPNPELQISHVALKLPPFWKSNIKLWFIQAESSFELSGITNDNTKYNNIIAIMDQETLSAVSDILTNPPATGKYNALKQRLLDEFTDSKITIGNPAWRC